MTRPMDNLHRLFRGLRRSEESTVTIHAGAGGVDAQHWASVVYEMERRWAERCGLTVETVTIEKESGQGIKTAVLKVRGRAAHTFMGWEHGVHRCVRISPFDFGQFRRQTSFVGVEVEPRGFSAIAPSPLGFGSQIRNYVLDPYHQAKDLRTGAETEKVYEVLRGRIDLLRGAP